MYSSERENDEELVAMELSTDSASDNDLTHAVNVPLGARCDVGLVTYLHGRRVVACLHF